MSSEQPKLNNSEVNNSTSGESEKTTPQQNAMASQPAPSTHTPETEETDDTRAGGDVDFGQLLDQFEQEQATLEEGEVVRGTVVGLSERGVVIDFGYKSEGIVNPAEFTENGQLTVKAGDEVEVLVKSMETADGLPVLSRADAVRRGVTSIKMFQAYRKRGMLFRDDQLLRGMQLTVASGALAMVHAENGDVIDLLEDQLIARGQTGPEHYLASRPHAAEAEAVGRAIRLAELAGCPLYVVHLSTAAGAAEVAAARARGQAVFGETCPQYLLLTDDEMRRQKGLAKIAPPLRWASDAEALWQALARGSVQTVGSDHAPFTVDYADGGK